MNRDVSGLQFGAEDGGQGKRPYKWACQMRPALSPNLKPPRALNRGCGSAEILVAVLPKDQGQRGWKRKPWRQATGKEWALKTLGRDGVTQMGG